MPCRRQEPLEWTTARRNKRRQRNTTVANASVSPRPNVRIGCGMSGQEASHIAHIFLSSSAFSFGGVETRDAYGEFRYSGCRLKNVIFSSSCIAFLYSTHARIRIRDRPESQHTLTPTVSSHRFRTGLLSPAHESSPFQRPPPSPQMLAAMHT